MNIGAEAIITQKGTEITKHRPRKSYRIEELDKTLRRSRTKREAKILQKLQDVTFKSPKIIQTDKESTIVMEKIEGKTVKDAINNQNLTRIATDIANKLAQLHNKGIIHGDLTTSNMIWNEEVYLIDFGLSFFSKKTEDKAVDLHVLFEALESKHPLLFQKAKKTILNTYKKTATNADGTLHRLEKVEARGRYKK